MKSRSVNSRSRHQGKQVQPELTMDLSKLIFNAKDHTLLGAHHGRNANVTEMIAELVFSPRSKGVTAHDIIKTVHPHPTMSEAVMEAAAAAYDEVIHL